VLYSVRALSKHQEIDWHALLETARAQDVTPLLYSIVHDRNLCPPQIEHALRLDYYSNVSRSVRFLCALEDVLRRLTAAGVPVILLKGTALAETVYGDAALRPASDIDLLVRQVDMPTALNVLSSSGYQKAQADLYPGYVTTYGNQVTVVKVDGPKVPVELHWSLIRPPYYQRTISMDWFWQTSRPLYIGDVSTLILGPEAQLLHSCAHILQHGGCGKAKQIWLHDLAEMIHVHHARIDWDQLLVRAQAYDLVLPVQRALNRVSVGWNTPVPPTVLARLRALGPSRDEVRIHTVLTTARIRAQRIWAGLWDIPGRRSKLRYAWHTLFPSAEYMQYRYRVPHRLLMPLYYAYRCYRGLQVVRGAECL
jgi:hypothetical protein